VQLYGIHLLGVNADNAKKLAFTLALIGALLLLRIVLHACARLVSGGREAHRIRFWMHQGINFITTLLFLLGVASIWFDDPARATTVMGLIVAGVAFALQKLITAIAGYFVILRGKTFNVGDRIVMGGVRGDVIGLDFIQTTILEMGQPSSVAKEATPAMWVMGRQPTGRIVTVSNGVIFDEPVYNYTRDFPYLFEEVAVGIGYDDKVKLAEQILLEVARAHTQDIEQLSHAALERLRRVYDLEPPDAQPRVYYRMTSNWVELAVRFLCRDHDIRAVKDAIYRDLLERFRAERISIASGTYEIVGLPPMRVTLENELNRPSPEGR
jgi:small-conductance mechanosensitive channel